MRKKPPTIVNSRSVSGADFSGLVMLVHTGSGSVDPPLNRNELPYDPSVRSDGLPWSNVKDAQLSISKGLKGPGYSESWRRQTGTPK